MNAKTQSAAEAIVILMYVAHDGGNIEPNGPFESNVRGPGGRIFKVSNSSVRKAALMNRKKSLN